jgi:4'-phosphopantetheinyl transferase
VNFELAADAVDVWRLRLDQPLEGAEVPRATLSADERSRARRMRSPEDRRRYQVARGCLRAILARYAQQPAHELVFDYEPLGRPTLHGSRGLTFSAAHAGDRGLIAVGRRPAIGIDIEPLSAATDVEAIADGFLPPPNVAAIRQAPAAARPRLWIELWTELEARAKLDGNGLADLNRDVAARLLGLPVFIEHVEVGDDWAGTLAYAGARARIRTFDFAEATAPG